MVAVSVPGLFENRLIVMLPEAWKAADMMWASPSFGMM
jgi:hypothetical protein